jgi:hypothetical protein
MRETRVIQARRLTTLLPAMTLAEAIETTRIHRVAGRTGDRTAWVTTRPCRAPHHPISEVGLIGGGQVPLPGTGRGGSSRLHARHPTLDRFEICAQLLSDLLHRYPCGIEPPGLVLSCTVGFAAAGVGAEEPVRPVCVERDFHPCTTPTAAAIVLIPVNSPGELEPERTQQVLGHQIYPSPSRLGS